MTVDYLLGAQQFHVMRGYQALPDDLRHAVLAIGNFDGVHRGHQAVLSVACDRAKQSSRPVLAMTFEPHPRAIFSPNDPLFYLTSLETKAVILDAFGLNGLIVVPFDLFFAAKLAQAFVSEVLIDSLAVFDVVTGYDFHFGKGRQGTPDYLKKLGREHDFGVTIVEAFCDDDLSGDDKVISSSRIRAALECGHIRDANHFLGYHWFVRGVVVHGDKRGRLLGYPTANIMLSETCHLHHGVYAVTLRVDGHVYQGVASFGSRPTFGSGKVLLEVHIFDFEGDLYGKEVDVAFIDFIRSEVTFSSVEELITAMNQDSIQARSQLMSQMPLSSLDKKLGFLNVF